MSTRVDSPPADGLAVAGESIDANGELRGFGFDLAEIRLQRLSNPAAMALGRRQAWHDMRTMIPLVLGDIIAGMIAVAAAVMVHSNAGLVMHAAFPVGVVLFVLLMHRLHGLYPACGIPYSVEFQGIWRSCVVVSVAAGFALLVSAGDDPFPLRTWASLSLMLFVSLAAVRPIARRVLARFDWWAQPVVVVGNGNAADRLFDRLSKLRHEGLRPLGIIFDPSRQWDVSGSDRSPVDDASKRLLGPISELESILFDSGACRLAMADHSGQHWQDFHCFHGIPHVMLPVDMMHQPTETVRVAAGDRGIELHCYTALTSPIAMLAKRIMDLVLIVVTLPLWLPLMIAIAVAIKWTDPGPIFYRQARVGRFRKPFNVIKFRSMVLNADAKLQDYLLAHPELLDEWRRTHKLKNDPRVTRVGEFLRKTSLDELPQIWNVLRGEMSLVGPRPIIDCGDYDREYIQCHPEVFELYQIVRPGITGLWQVSGRNATSYEKRVHFDRKYLHNWSITLDIYILWRTVKTALLQEGAC